MSYQFAGLRPRGAFRVEVAPYRGVEASVGTMRTLVQQGQAHPAVRRYAADVVRRVYPKDYLSELGALYYAACRDVRYTRDPANREMLHHPAVVLQEGVGDCDDFADLLGALHRTRERTPQVLGALGTRAAAVGNDAQFVTVGFDRRAPRGQRYTHVFLRVQDPHGGRWLVLDPVAGPSTPEMIRRTQLWRAYPT